MPELPEIAQLARQMNEELPGRTIAATQVLQPKCLNLSEAAFAEAVIGARFRGSCHRGKWVVAETTQGWLLFCLGMGGEILLVTRDTLPAKHRLILDFNGDACLAVNFWWLGHVHYAAPEALAQHKLTAKLGPSALELDQRAWQELLDGRRGRVKYFLLDQSRVAGIGNFYVHDILFRARLHPLRGLDTLTGDERTGVLDAIQETLRLSLSKGGSHHELDLYGRKGGYCDEDLLVGYREGQPCPVCGTLIGKIKTGSTASFVCASCQPLE